MKRITLLSLLALTACRQDSDTPLGVAQSFVDQYYVEINLAAAKTYCTGLALRKVEEQQRLTAGLAIDESTRKPLVRYSLLETKGEGTDNISYLFEGTVYVSGAESFSNKWLVSTRRDRNDWKVSNFAELP
jgi:hypothetical protein